MKFLHYPVDALGKDAIDVLYSCSEADGTLTLTLTVGTTKHRTPQTFTLSFVLSEHSGKVYNLSTAYSLITNTDVRMEELLSFIDRGYNISSPWEDKSRIQLGRLVFDPEAGPVMLGACPCPDAEGAENVQLTPNSGVTASASLKAHSPLWATLSAKAGIKANMIHHVDYFASLSYLEAQVDLLTRIVLAQLAGTTPDPDLVAALGVADSHSVLDIKPLPGVSAEFTGGKAHLRDLQTAYYAAKQATAATLAE